MKILIVYALSGIGHKKAAESIYEALKKNNESCQFYLIDILDYASCLLVYAYSKIYLFLIKNLRFFWGFIFYLTDNRKFHFLFGFLKSLFENINSRRFQDYLLKENFDIIISTHFSSSHIAGYLKKNGKIKAKLITVVTDYRAHSVWFVEGSDYFIVASNKTKEDLQRNNISSDKIKVLGIPAGLEFSVNKDTDSIREKLQISPKELTIMVMSGGIGIGPYEYLMKKLFPFKEKVNVLFVCGYNKKLYNCLRVLSKKLNTPFKIYQYIDNVDELMQISDIIITKAGGISLTESLIKKLPMLVVSPIPGQEKLNSELMADLGVMKLVETKKEAFTFIKQLINNPDILKRMRGNIEKIVQPNTAEEVVRFAKGIK